MAVSLAWSSVVIADAAQEPVVAFDDYLRRQWEVEDGLPDNTVTAITQTRDGYLWIGTQRGLVRFDGASFRVFTPANSPALASANVRFLAEAGDGALWVGLDRGGIARCRAGTFEMMTPLTLSSTHWPTSLAADASDGVWVGLPELRAMRWKAGQWTQFGEANGLSGRGAVTCVADAKGRIWFTTETSCGFFDGRRFVVLGSDMLLPHLQPGRNGKFWLARATLLLQLTEKLELLETGNLPWRSGSAEIQTLCEDRRGTLWVGTRGQGLFRFADGKFTRVPTSHNLTVAIREDREGNLWIGTWGGGLNCLQPRQIKLHDSRHGLPTDVIYSICQDNDGALWFASRNAGATRLADGRYTVFTAGDGWPGGVLTSLCPDRDGGVWFGTLATGLLHWQNGAFTDKGLKGELIESLLQGRDGALWIGSVRGGLLRWQNGQVTRMPTADGLQEITALAEDSAGSLWVGTRNGTLHRYQSGLFERYDCAKDLPGSAIQTILADGPNALWIGTRDGLLRFAHGRFSRLTTRHGLQDDDIRQILMDDAGNLWFGSSRGLFRAGRADLEALAAGRRAAVDCVAYGRSDGLGSFEFSEGYHRAACRARDGRLWFATRRGAVEVNPKELLVSSEPPLVRIEEVVADDEPLSVSGCILIPPRCERLQVRYVALSFAAPEKVRFRYRLEGADRDWVDAGRARVATFLRTPPGRHRFQVTACNAEGVWNTAGATLDFIVEPALWQTTWFRLAAIGVVMALAAGLGRFAFVRRVQHRLRLLEQQHALDQERARIAKDMHDDVGASLTHIALMSEAARQDQNLTGETASRLERIARTARDISQTLDQIVWTLNPRNDTVEALINYLSQHTAEYLAATGIQLEQEMPESVPHMAIPSDLRTHLFLAAKEALHNAVKHAAANKIRLHIAVESGRLCVQIADNGKGFSPEERATAGNGLTNMRHRLAAIGGGCQIESQPGKGTQVTFMLPMNRK